MMEVDHSDHHCYPDHGEEKEEDLMGGARVELDALVICSAVPGQTIIPDQNSLNDTFFS